MSEPKHDWRAVEIVIDGALQWKLTILKKDGSFVTIPFKTIDASDGRKQRHARGKDTRNDGGSVGRRVR